MLRDEPMKIGLKIIQGNIPNNFKDQIVNVYLYHYDDELGMCIGCHSVNIVKVPIDKITDVQTLSITEYQYMIDKKEKLYIYKKKLYGK